MWYSKMNAIYVVILSFYVISVEIDSIKVPLISKNLKDVGDTLENVGKKAKNNIEENIADSLDTAQAVSQHVTDPVNVIKNLTKLVESTAVFTRNNVTLNCFGLPIKSFAKVLEQIFTQETNAKDVRFYFSSRKHPDYITVRLDSNFTLQDVHFDVTRATVLISHGFMSSGQESWLRNMKDAFLKLDDFNVIVVDWQKGSNTWNYFSAAISTRIVGEQIAKLFAQLRDKAIASDTSSNISEWGKLYFIGHSLGSHICAHAAYLIKQSQRNESRSWNVARITGLDPAQPCFQTVDLSLKLDKNDATFVDVIHTNAKHILFLGLGLPDKLGYVDFYPNGGKVQPGCSDIDTSIWNFLLLPKNIIEESICSHGRSHTFLIESVTSIANGNCTFIGYKWNRSSDDDKRNLSDKCAEKLCIEMGVNSAHYYPKNDGVYFVPTRSTAPFCVDEENENRQFKNEDTSSRIQPTRKRFFI